MKWSDKQSEPATDCLALVSENNYSDPYGRSGGTDLSVWGTFTGEFWDCVFPCRKKVANRSRSSCHTFIEKGYEWHLLSKHFRQRAPFEAKGLLCGIVHSFFVGFFFGLFFCFLFFYYFYFIYLFIYLLLLLAHRDMEKRSKCLCLLSLHGRCMAMLAVTLQKLR